MPAQTLTEAAVAASGGTVAGMAGKTVSDGISGIMGAVAKQTNRAATNAKDAKPKETNPQLLGLPKPGPMTYSDPGSSPSGYVVRPTSTRAAATVPSGAEPAPVAASYQAPAVVPEPAPLPDASPEVLATITVGTAKQELITKAGTPGSRIVMDEDGHLVEVYRYLAKGSTIASIRLTDGAVTSVKLVEKPKQ